MEMNSRRLVHGDEEMILHLEEKNERYFAYLGEKPTLKSAEEDLDITPPSKSIKDKEFLGFFFGEELIGIMDIIHQYPNTNTVFIGFFMIAFEMQNKGFGKKILMKMEKQFVEKGYSLIRLGVIINNVEGKSFWMKNGFTLVEEKKENNPPVLVLEKRIR